MGQLKLAASMMEIAGGPKPPTPGQDGPKPPSGNPIEALGAITQVLGGPGGGKGGEGGGGMLGMPQQIMSAAMAPVNMVKGLTRGMGMGEEPGGAAPEAPAPGGGKGLSSMLDPSSMLKGLKPPGADGG